MSMLRFTAATLSRVLYYEGLARFQAQSGSQYGIFRCWTFCCSSPFFVMYFTESLALLGLHQRNADSTEKTKDKIRPFHTLLTMEAE